MAAITSVVQPTVPNRRRRVRHKIQTPAYATFQTGSKGTMLDLYEIVNISEEGIAIQCHSPLDAELPVSLRLDLADCRGHIQADGQVIWSNGTGRAGIRFSELSNDSLARLREWLFVNVMARVANGEVDLAAIVNKKPVAPRPNYTDTLAAVAAVQRQVEALGADLAAALQLLADRAKTLTRASGAAIALSERDLNYMVCRASSGTGAPPAGVRLQIGAGFSGRCVSSGTLLRCDDTELDTRVDRDTCQALGIRSILAAPIHAGDRSVGLIEVLSGEPRAFAESDERALLRLAELVLDAANRAARAESLPPLSGPAEAPFAAPPGSVLFASADQRDTSEPEVDEKTAASLSLTRSHLVILVCAAAAIALALGFVSAPWVQTEGLPWIKSKLHARGAAQLTTVLASSQPPKSDSSAVAPAAFVLASANLEQLRQIADQGDPSAQNALGLRYATGDGVTIDEGEAVRWFTKAAEQGFVPAQSKLGSIYFSGRGVPQDSNRAYFWMVVARLSGDDASKALAPFVRARLSRAQVTSIELDADQWLQQHRMTPKPAAAQ